MRRNKGLCFYKKRRRFSADTTREIGNYAAGIIIAVGLAFFLVYSFGMKTSVIGVSMENTLYSGQTVFVNRIAYLFFPPKAGDIVVFLPNGNVNTHFYVKRVVAVPGDTVEFMDGRLYVNGVKEEEEQYDKVAEPGLAEVPVHLDADEYFVLGDNRNNSEDSRSGNIGKVNREIIVGKVWFHMGSHDEGIGFMH